LTASENGVRREELDYKLAKMQTLCGQVKSGNITDEDTLAAKPCKQRKSIKSKRDKMGTKEAKCLNRVATIMKKAVRLETKIDAHNKG